MRWLGGATGSDIGHVKAELVKSQNEEPTFHDCRRDEPKHTPDSSMRQDNAPSREMESGEPGQVEPERALWPMASISFNHCPEDEPSHGSEASPASGRHPRNGSKPGIQDDCADKRERDEELEGSAPPSTSKWGCEAGVDLRNSGSKCVLDFQTV